MSYKTCPDCGSRVFEHGCVNCNEADYISMQAEPEDRFGHKGFMAAMDVAIGNANKSEQPKEAEHIVKARELVEKFQKNAYGKMGSPQNFREAKACAIICCEEIINYLGDEPYFLINRQFWQNVKNEILKL
jgi:hypothetical protein